MSFGHDVSVPEVGSEIREAVENALKEAVAIPVDELPLLLVDCCIFLPSTFLLMARFSIQCCL